MCISIADSRSFHRASCANRIEGKIAVEFAIDADQKVEIEFRGHA